MNSKNIIVWNNKIVPLLIIVLSSFPILPYVIRSILLILLIVCSLLYLMDTKSKIQNTIFSLIICVIPFFFLIASLSYSYDLERGLQRLIQMMAYLALPLILYTQSHLITKTILEKILIVFACSVIIIVLFQVFYSLYYLEFIMSQPTRLEIKNLNLPDIHIISEDVINQIKLRRFRNFIKELTDTHTTYQGLWIVFALAIVVKNIFISKFKINKLVLVFFGTVLLSWLFLISARSPLFALIIASIVSLIHYNHKKGKLSLKGLSILILSSILSLFLVYKILPGFKLKVDEVIETKFELPTSTNDIYKFNSTNVRFGIYFCSVDIIKKNLLIGVGIGDLQNELNACYNNKIGAKVYLWNDYNTHNQFLFFWTSTGVFGFVFFALLIFYAFFKALKTSDSLYLFFTICCSIVFLTENVLSRSDGVIFYAFFNSIMLFKINDNN